MHRQGPVCNLKKEVLSRAKKHTGDVRVGNTKLVPNLAVHIPWFLLHLIEGYVAKHRPSLQPENENYVFFTPGGRKVAHLSDDLRALSKDFPTELGVINGTAMEMRK